MARKPTPQFQGTASLWEAGPIELKAYVDRRLAAFAAGAPADPAWFGAEFEASWAISLAEADAT